MEKKALIILAEGFEEIEAVAPMDILRRSGVNIVVAGLGGKTVTGAHGVKIEADVVFEDHDSMPDVIVFPGGMPGAENLSNSVKIKDLVMRMNSSGKLIAAICASPALVLGPTGILEGRKATCYPGLEKNFSSRVKFEKENVVQDGNVITSRGPATAFAFGLKIAENLVGKEKANMIAKQILWDQAPSP